MSDFGALDVRTGEGGDWSTPVGRAGQALATCDSRWPTAGSDRSICALK